MFYKITLGFIAIWTLTACGGGGGSNTPPNTVPTATIEEVTSKLEGMTVELNASASYDNG